MSPVCTWLARSWTQVRRVKRNVLMLMSRGDRQAMTDAILLTPSSACDAVKRSVQAPGSRRKWRRGAPLRAIRATERDVRPCSGLGGGGTRRSYLIRGTRTGTRVKSESYRKIRKIRVESLVLQGSGAFHRRTPCAYDMCLGVTVRGPASSSEHKQHLAENCVASGESCVARETVKPTPISILFLYDISFID